MGRRYQWTRKVRGKTVSVALSREQFLAPKAAIAEWKQIETTLKRMQQISRAYIFGTTPDTHRRKKLSKRVLGLI